MSNYQNYEGGSPNAAYNVSMHSSMPPPPPGEQAYQNQAMFAELMTEASSPHNERHLQINPSDNNTGVDGGGAVHWGSPTNPTSNDAYFQDNYNSLQPSTSDHLWTMHAYPPPPPMGTPYAYPTPPAGSDIAAPRMGFYQPTDGFIRGGNNDYSQIQAANGANGENMNTNAVAMPGSWVDPPPPDFSCNKQELCSVIWAMLFQGVVQVHLVFLIICMTQPYAEGAAYVCYTYFWQREPVLGPVSGAFIGVVSGCAGVYLIECFISPFARYVWNLRTRIESFRFFAKLADTRPELWWSIQCYHYETRHYTDSKGRSKTKRVRVNTHSARGHYSFSSWRNVGPPPLIQNFKATRVRLEKEYTFADEATKRDYDVSFASWVAANDRDTHKDVSSGFELEGFESFFLSMIRDREGEKSCEWLIFNNICYWVCVLLTLSGFFRMILIAKTNGLSYTFVKEIKR